MIKFEMREYELIQQKIENIDEKFCFDGLEKAVRLARHSSIVMYFFRSIPIEYQEKYSNLIFDNITNLLETDRASTGRPLLFSTIYSSNKNIFDLICNRLNSNQKTLKFIKPDITRNFLIFNIIHKE